MTPAAPAFLAAPGGELIQAGTPSPADSSPAATVAGGLTGVGGVSVAAPMGASNADDAALLVGMLSGAGARDDDFERAQRARDLYLLLKPLLDLPERHRGRRALAEEIGRALGKSFQQVYRLAEIARERGVMGLARLGQRRDRGQARTLISGPWLAWAEALAAEWPGAADVARLAERMRRAVRSAWVGGAPSARQCWLKATAYVAKTLLDEGCPSHFAAALLSVKAPRKWLEAEGKNFRVAGRSLRDAKACYDRNITPVKRTAAGLKPGDLVCGDITPLDIPVLRDDGSTAYARIVMWHDIATNWLWHDLVLLEAGEGIRREHVAASYARMCEQAPFGAPRRLYLDNGSEYKWEEMLVAAKRLADFTGQAFRADEAALLPADQLVIRSIPFKPRGKRVEGMFGNLTDWLGWWMGYVGGNRMTKKVATLGKGVSPMPFAAVASWLRRTMDDYHATPQPGAEHMGGMSPQERIDAFIAQGWKPWKVDRLLLALAFADYETRRVTRGAIQFDGRTWTADFLMVIEGRVTVARPRILGPDFECIYVLDGARILGFALPERRLAITDASGAKEASRRAKAFRVLVADKINEAGGPLDEAKLAGVRADLLGLDATLERAAAAALTVEPSADVLSLMEGLKRAEEARIARINAEAQARRDAESLNRFGVEDDEETKLARAMGL